MGVNWPRRLISASTCTASSRSFPSGTWRAIAASCPRVRHWVALCDADTLGTIDLQGVSRAEAYETLVPEFGTMAPPVA